MHNETIWADWNGEICNLDDVKVSPLDRGFLFGDSVYEGIRVYNGRIWLIDQHMNRLRNSLDGVRITFETSSVIQRCENLINEKKLLNGFLYVQITRGVGPRTHSPPPNLKPNCLIFFLDLTNDPYEEKRNSGVTARTQLDTRWKMCQFKTTNLLGNVLAQQQSQEQGYSETILISEETNGVTESTHANVFCVSNKTISTPSLSTNILPGVTRQFIIQMARELDFNILEKEIPKPDLFSADEVFLTGTMTQVLPIIEIDHKKIGTGEPGPISLEILNHFRNRTMGRQ